MRQPKKWFIGMGALWTATFWLGCTCIAEPAVDPVPSRKGEGGEFGVSLLGREEGSQSLSLPTKKGDQFFVRGFYGKLALVGRPWTQSLSVRSRRVNPGGFKGENWGFSLRREGQKVELVVVGPDSKSEWHLGKNNQRPQFEFIIEAPPMAAEVHWKEGRVDIKEWKSNLLVNLGKGQIRSANGTGLHKMSLQEGHLEVEAHVGTLELESYKGKVQVVNSDSSVDLENFAGASVLEKVSGEIHFRSYKGRTDLSECEGKLEFKNRQSPVKVKKFKGVIRGESQQGAVRISSLGRVDIHIVTQEGAVHLNLPRSAAQVDLGSVRGALYVPSFLNFIRLSHFKVKRGALKGTQPGNVYVRTQSGQIFLK